MSRVATRLTLIGILAVTVLSYTPLWAVGMVYEDAVVVGSVDTTFMEKPLMAFPNRWLSMQSFRTGVTPDAVHATTLALHLVNGGLWYLVLRTWWASPAALAAVAVVLWHPLATEAVVTFTGRMDVLMTTGWLLAVLGARRQQWGLAVAGLLGACLSKEIGIAGVGVVALVAWQQGHRWIAWGSVLGAVALLVPMSWWLRVPAVAHGEFAWQQLAVLGTFAQLAVVPVGLSISHDAAAMHPVMPLLALALAAALVWAGVSRGGLLAVSVALVAMPLWPRFLVFGVETISERQVYAALFGVSVVLVMGVVRVGDVMRGLLDIAEYRPLRGWTVLEKTHA
jgi:hypothetical protein